MIVPRGVSYRPVGDVSSNLFEGSRACNMSSSHSLCDSLSVKEVAIKTSSLTVLLDALWCGCICVSCVASSNFSPRVKQSVDFIQSQNNIIYSPVSIVHECFWSLFLITSRAGSANVRGFVLWYRQISSEFFWRIKLIWYPWWMSVWGVRMCLPQQWPRPTDVCGATTTILIGEYPKKKTFGSNEKKS